MTDPGGLSDEQIDCAFDYFLLYDQHSDKMDLPATDPESLVSLLKEKQNDLELAAQIGKSLLERNRELDRQLNDTEHQMATAIETINQLQHSLGIKDELLQMCHHDSLEFGLDETHTQSSRSIHSQPCGNSPMYATEQSKQDELALINLKIQALEEDNANIRNERASEHGGALRDCMRKLAEALVYIRNLSDEQFKRSDALGQQQNQLNALLARSRELENNLNHVGLANEMLASKVDELNSVNQNLNMELRDVKDKYDESCSMYTEAQEQMRKLKQRSRKASLRPACVVYNPLSPPPLQHHSSSSSSHHNAAISPPPCFSPPTASLSSRFPNRLCHPQPHSPILLHHRQQNVSIAEELGEQQIQLTDRLSEGFVGKAHDEGLAQPHPYSYNQDVSLHLETGNRTSQCVSAMPSEHECVWDDSTIASSGFISCSDPIENIRKPDGFKMALPQSVPRCAVMPNDHLQQLDFDGGFSWDESIVDTDQFVEDSDEDIEQDLMAKQLDVHLQGLSLNPKEHNFNTSGVSQCLHKKRSASKMANRCSAPRSWILDDSLQNEASAFYNPNGRQRSLDDSVVETAAMTTVSSQSSHPSIRNPQRLKLIKEFRGSGILQRWQKLATPSITSALFETPMSGVLNRAASTPLTSYSKFISPGGEIGQSSSCISANSNQDPSYIGNIFSIAQNHGRSTPMGISSLFASPIVNEDKSSTVQLLNQFLTSQRVNPSARIFHRGSIPNINHHQDPQTSPGSPVAGDSLFRRSMSPVCRGLLDISDMSHGGESIGKEVKINVPIINRPQSPEESGVRLHRTTPAAGLLNSVKEECS